MTEEQNVPIGSVEYRRGSHAARAQERQARYLAKQAARDARYAARANRLHHNWTFEVHLGEKVYSFTWRWHGQAAGESEAPAEQQAPDQAATEPEAAAEQ